jgi:hypothetical protein
MERPVMNPRYMDGALPPPVKRTLRRRFWDMVRSVFGLLLLDLRVWKYNRLEMEDAPQWQRLLRGVTYRLLMLPLLAAVAMAGLVYQGTHPPILTGTEGPAAISSHYEVVEFSARDGTALQGWFVPALDARAVIDKREKILRHKHPAVVLVHDHGAAPGQMLPLVQPLHERGYIVLVAGLRGSSGPRSVSTFGLREADDVRAAVDLLRRRKDVDANGIAVVGVGTGANAAMLAWAQGMPIKALILNQPVQEPRELVCEHLALPQPWMEWARPSFRWAFELAYRVDTDDINPARYEQMLQSGPVLMLNSSKSADNVFRAGGLDKTRRFLAQHLGDSTDVAGIGP